MSKQQPMMFKDIQMYGVKWDVQAVSVVQTIADGLVENAKALHALAEVLRASNVHIDAMIKVENPKP